MAIIKRILLGKMCDVIQFIAIRKIYKSSNKQKMSEFYYLNTYTFFCIRILVKLILEKFSLYKAFKILKSIIMLEFTVKGEGGREKEIWKER